MTHAIVDLPFWRRIKLVSQIVIATVVLQVRIKRLHVELVPVRSTRCVIYRLDEFSFILNVPPGDYFSLNHPVEMRVFPQRTIF